MKVLRPLFELSVDAADIATLPILQVEPPF
jgi:hypothetical protein